jgi:sugar lactone lactonase YvrE
MNVTATTTTSRSRIALAAKPAAVCMLFALKLPAIFAQGGQAASVFYPEPPEKPRIQFLGTFNSEKDLGKKTGGFRHFVLGEEDETDALVRPYGLAVFEDRIFVCDSKAASVAVFDLKAKELSRIGNRSPGRLSRPINIAVDADGTRYVADTGHKRIMVYGRDDTYQRALGDPAKFNPSDVLVAGNELFVCDVDNGRVLVLDKNDGTQKRTIGTKGSGEGQLFFPTNLARDTEGNLFVADTGNTRIVEFNLQGRFTAQFGQAGDRPGMFTRPKGIALDREGRLYVVDAAFENIQLFDRDHQLLLFFAGPGNHPGGINLPTKVAIDYDHVDYFRDRVAKGYQAKYLILVASQYGENKVNVYGFLEQKH